MAKLVFNPISGNFDTVYDKAEEIKYAPIVGGDWTVPLPTTVQEGLDSVAARVSFILSLSNTQQIYIDAVAGDDTNGNGSVLQPYQTIHKALTIATNPALTYVFNLSPGNYTGINTNIAGNISLIGNNSNIQFVLTYTAAAGDEVYPVYSGVSFNDFQMDLSLSNIALPVFLSCGINLTRTDATTGPRFIQIINCTAPSLSVTGNIAVSNSLFTGTCDIQDQGSLLLNNCVVGISIAMDPQATLSMIACTFVGSVNGSTSGPNTSIVRADSSSLTQGGVITGCNFAYADASQFIAYVPATPGDWITPPIQTADALDILAATKFPSPSGLSSQYIRGDGTLADFPPFTGGGSSVSYYLNGSISQGTILGNTYYQMSKTPIEGAGTDFTITNQVNGLVSEWITDAGDPVFLNIPAGAWNIQAYFSVNQNNIQPTFYVELLKYDGAAFTSIANSSANPEAITNGTAIDLYYTSLAVPATTLSLTDRLAIRIYVDTVGNHTVTHHTEDSHLSQIITTFSTGINSLNGLSDQVQTFGVGTSGTDFNISSSSAAHTFNLPDASATNRGALTAIDWADFDAKVDTGLNLGGGDEVFKQNNAGTLEFKTLVAGSNITLTPAADTLTISSTDTGEVNTASNVGAGAGVFKTKSAQDLQFKSLVAGTNISLSVATDTITIAASGGGGSPGSFTGFILDTFNGDGTTTIFTLSAAPTSAAHTDIFIGGVYQQKATYTVVGTTLTFTEAPPTGVSNIEVKIFEVLTATLGGGTTGQVLTKNSNTSGDYSWATPATSGVEIFNSTITLGSSASTATGLLYFIAPSNLTVSSVLVQIYEKGSVSSGILEADIKRNSTPNDTGMTSIFSVKPSFDFALVSDYAVSNGTISTGPLASGDYLRLDLTSIPSGFKGSLQILAYA